MCSAHSCRVLAVAGWIALLAGGWFVLLRHELTAGPKGRLAPTWPTDTAVRLDPERPTLVLFAHRSCPCTRATLSELARILHEVAGRVNVQIVLCVPEGAEADRVGDEMESLARTLPGAQVLVDSEAAEARRFRVRTSGHIVLYSPDGHLLFSGGITDGRGHVGPSPGGQAVLAWLLGTGTETRAAPVYGCSLFEGEESE